MKSKLQNLICGGRSHSPWLQQNLRKSTFLIWLLVLTTVYSL